MGVGRGAVRVHVPQRSRGDDRRRREWFEAPTETYIVLWWVPAGHIPTVEEADERLDHLRAHGPTPYAFTFKQRYPPPGE